MAAAISSETNMLSFKFSKKIEKKVILENKHNDSSTTELEETDFVLSVDGDGVRSSQPKPKKKDLVIPLIKTNVWRLPRKENTNTNSSEDISDAKDPGELSLEQQAVKEILSGVSSTGQDENGVENTRSIPLLVQNKVPEGYETDEKVDVTLRAEEPTMDDYENVPIEEYGLAMLRGMGWAPGKPIGARCTQVIELKDVVLRPKGLGLGAESKARKAPAFVAKEEGQLVLRKGAYVYIEQGPHKDLYGQVEGLDDENARVLVKLALGGKIATVNELFIRLVTQKEYQKEGKLLNKDKYEDYKRKHEPQEEELMPPPQEYPSSKKHKSEKTHKHHASSSKKESSKVSHHKKSENWLRPQIRVRFIDEKFRNGKYYNMKMTIEDVTSLTTCLCNTEDGKILEDVTASMLETVIPRKSPGYVMVLTGRYCGQVGTVVQRNKDKCRAMVQMLRDKEVREFDYDTISEYVGDVSHQYY
ncbi:G-patch domain and KOW motifs-containing protein-like [Ornithodoros turicata]|uniref:G-patch domain and KOW motifs-containing protein-like n=1 Tax=Ornithodoros turicata TaxID=34597 RepID=UPI003139A079